jgi:tRNA synthetases class I (E and Q), catalytic domain
MRRGKIEENKATLRLKMDMTSPNPNMWDQIAYRIRYAPHPHAGEKWCIYPTYDYTHCIVDSLEHIDYSICTLEFETRRESYYWLLEALKVYRPKVRVVCVYMRSLPLFHTLTLLTSAFTQCVTAISMTAQRVKISSMTPCHFSISYHLMLHNVVRCMSSHV